jgi:hypothetical protein
MLAKHLLTYRSGRKPLPPIERRIQLVSTREMTTNGESHGLGVLGCLGKVSKRMKLEWARNCFRRECQANPTKNVQRGTRTSADICAETVISLEQALHYRSVSRRK